MKICFVTSSLSKYHGYGRVSLDLISGLQKLGISGPILTLKFSNIPSTLKSRTFPILINQPTSPLKNPLKLFKDYQAIRNISENCQGIHFLTESHLATTFFNYHKPYIVTTYGTWAIRPLKANLITSKVFTAGYDNAKAVVSISNYTKNRLNKLVPQAKHHTIHLGIDKNKWQKNTSKPIKHNKLNILSVAALHPSKGLHISLEAIAKYSLKSPPTSYKIISGTKNKKYKQKLIDLATKNNLKEFKIIQRVSDRSLKNYYHQADIFIHTPIKTNEDFEGFGLIIPEAFAAKIPVIASNSGAIPEIVINNKTGILVPENNQEAIVRAISKLRQKNEFRNKLIENAFRKLSYYSIDRMAQDYKKVYVKAFKL